MRYLRIVPALIALPLSAVICASARPPTLDPTYGLRAPAQKPAEAVAGKAARWIWAAHTANGQVVGVRRDFELPDQPSEARLIVTADNYFTAFVNGKRVGGTAPQAGGYEWRTAHTFNVASLLHTGQNVIAIRGENADGDAGVLAVLQYRAAGGPAELVTDTSWKVSEVLPQGWEQPAFSDAEWHPATSIAPLGGGPWGSDLAGWPGLTGAPYLLRLDVPVRSVVVIEGRGGAVAGASTLIGRGPASMTLTPAAAGTAEGHDPAVLVDFGQETSGRVEVTNGSAAPLDITLRYGESDDEAQFGPYTGVQKISIPAHGVGAGIDSAFRYAVVTVVSGPPSGALIRRVRLNMDYYPVTYRGSFDCSDPLLTRIWYTGAYTAHLCMQQDIWDAPKRDRARWMGDLQVSGEVINNAFLDRFLMEQTMDRLRSDAGSPPRGHVNGIPGYSCAWVVGMADFYRHTGDTAYILRHHDDLVQMLDYFRGELDDRGLFADLRGQWNYTDWSPGFNDKTPHSLAATHFYMIRMLKDGAWLLDQMNDHAAADRYRKWADDATRAAEQYLRDPATNTFGDRWQDNAMAIDSGAASPSEQSAIWEHVLSHPYPVTQMITPYYNNYTIFAMAQAGHTNEALNFVRSYWGGMLAEGATTFWEGYDTRWPKEHYHRFLQADNGMGYFVSLSHGWSAGATDFLTERILGVRSTGPGFRTVDIEPELSDLQWASGDVPTPGGNIHVRCRRVGTQQVTDIDLPPGVTATIRLPGKAPVTFKGRHFHGIGAAA